MKKITLKKIAAIVLLAGIFMQSCEKDDTINDDGENGNGNGNWTEVPKTTANFSEIELEAESFWNGSDESGGFISGNVFFPNYFDTEWNSWSGFAVSNITDNETNGYENQYSAITGTGYEDNENYAVVYVSDPVTFENYMSFELTGEAVGNKVYGIYITNSTWAALTIRDGDDFLDPFGQGDYFKATFTGYYDGDETASVDFVLADYRHSNPDEHYIVKTWEWVDLVELGDVDEVVISLTSTDVDDWGMQTPAYICIGKIITFDEPLIY